MRSNTPVSQIEYILRDGQTVVSKTDLQGNITYVNADFVAISGFSEEELLGAPQNIVRHPDMPVEAFADFWHTIKSGKAWTGMVKNRCKNGDYYWVEANAAPLIEQGRMVGFTSVRVKPSRAQVNDAEAAYRAIKQGDHRCEIREGDVVRRSAWRHAGLLNKLSLGARIGAGSVVVALLFAINLATDGAVATAAAAFGLAASLLSGALLYRAIVAPLVRAKADIAQMSEGDLTGKIKVDGNNELAQVLQALRVLQTNIKLLVGQIKEASDVVGSGSVEMAASNADLSARTEAQASSLEETASSMEEISSTVKQNADNARQANQLATTAASTAAQGGLAVGQVVATMEAIRDSSRKIVDIISVIDGIAFQTNILALNAAVEAARAGEQGRGFAVVASEVRNLAQRSAAAAKEIKTLITTSVDKVDAGSALVDSAGKTMDLIVSSVQQVAAIMNEITIASREQSEGIDQVSQAISQMDEITQRNAAVVEEAAAAAEGMQQQAATLAALLNAFKLVPMVAHASTGGRIAAQPVPLPRRAPATAPAAIAASARRQLTHTAAPPRQTRR
jgi:aerotaxis receptor